MALLEGVAGYVGKALLLIPGALSAKLDTYGLASTLLRALVGPEHYPGEHAETEEGRRGLLPTGLAPAGLQQDPEQAETQTEIDQVGAECRGNGFLGRPYS